MRRAGARTLPVVAKYVDDIVTVDEEEIANAILLLLEREKTVAEGAGAAALAALVQGSANLHGKKVAVVIGGGNIDVNVLSRIIERGLVKDGRLVRLRVRIPDHPGGLHKLTGEIASVRANIQEVIHNRAFSRVDLGETAVDVTLETRGAEHIDELVQVLQASAATSTSASSSSSRASADAVEGPISPDSHAIVVCSHAVARVRPNSRRSLRLPATPLRVTELGAFKFGSKLERRIVQKIGQAVADFGLIDEGDRIMVCVSGGKDSYALLDALLLLARKSPVRYELVAVNVDQGWPGLPDRGHRRASRRRAASNIAWCARTRSPRSSSACCAPRRRAPRRARSARACAAACSMASPRSSAPPRSRSATTSTIWPRRC